jgi:hypothetical protein
MYTALGLTSLDQVISIRNMRCAGHVRRMDWSGSLASSSHCGLMHLAAEDGHSFGRDLTRELQLIGFSLQGGRAARRLAELGGCHSR